MSFTIHQVGEITEGRYLQKGNTLCIIKYLLIDSRQVIFPENSLFFALSGKRQNGHHYIQDAYQKGVRSFLISEKINVVHFPDANFILVKNVLESLQLITRRHREKFHLPIIGITGSNGKTIIKEWLNQLLQIDKKIVRSPKSFNSQIGVPLSVWQIGKGDELGIFEAGISQKKEMKRLAKIIQPQIGIFTNIGAAHNEGFKNQKEKIEEKLKLFKITETIIFCEDHSSVSKAIRKKYADRELYSWTFKKKKKATLKISKKEIKEGSTFLESTFKKRKAKFIIPFTDRANVENALHCCLTLLHLGYDASTINQRLQTLEPMNMRLEMKSAINGCLLLNDSYSNDLTALRVALDFMEQQTAQRARTVILSDVLQSGLSPNELYKNVAQLFTEKKIKKVIGIGSEITVLKKHLSKKTETTFFKNTSDFIKKLAEQQFKNETILLKGARTFEFEKIANRLAQKAHQTVLEINLNAIKHNLNIYASYLKPEVKMMVMVKASGYGSGSVEVARLLEFQKVDYLAVAYADEGVELREAGIKLPILVLNPEEATFNKLFQYQLEPEVYSLSQLSKLIHALPPKLKLPIHIKIDTGMRRLGFSSKDISTLSDILKKEKRLIVKSVFSHLVGSEDVQHDQFSKQQFKTFSAAADTLQKKLGYSPMRHILNSAGIFRFPDLQMDMVRLGIGIYGIDGSNTISDKLQNVMTLKATISQINHIKKNETVGYSRKGKASKNMRIGTISVGYADGFLRAAGNGNFSVLVNGKLAPTVGNICMDMSMIDLTDIPDVTEGDEVIIFGKTPSAESLADCYGTIAYEVFTNISQRVKRVYFEE